MYSESPCPRFSVSDGLPQIPVSRCLRFPDSPFHRFVPKGHPSPTLRYARRYRASGSRFQVPGSKFQVPGVTDRRLQINRARAQARNRARPYRLPITDHQVFAPPYPHLPLPFFPSSRFPPHPRVSASPCLGVSSPFALPSLLTFQMLPSYYVSKCLHNRRPDCVTNR